MSRPSTFDAFLGTFRYTVIQSVRNLSAGWFIGVHVLGPLAFLLTSWTILQILGPATITQFVAQTGLNDYIPFVIVGFAFQSVVMMTVYAGVNGIREEQQFGTAEAVFVTPSNKAAWFIGKIAAGFITALISTAAILTVSLLSFSFKLNAQPDVPSAAAATFLTLVGMTLWPTIIFLTGLAFPVEALPAWIQPVSWAFPITHGLVLTRGAALKGYNILAANQLGALASLLILTAIYLPVGYVSFFVFLNKARSRGDLYKY